MFDQLKKLGDQINEEKIQRIRLEERLNNLQKGGALPPPPKEEVKEKKEDVKKDEIKKDDKEPKKDLKKEDLKKDDKDISNLSKLKVARVSHVVGGVVEPGGADRPGAGRRQAVSERPANQVGGHATDLRDAGIAAGSHVCL